MLVQEITDVVGRYTKDIFYDAHQTETKIERSEARKALQEIGVPALKAIAEEMRGLFPSSEPTDIDYDMLLAYARLITGIIIDHHLPAAPYESTVKYGDQDPKKWILYCETNG